MQNRVSLLIIFMAAMLCGCQKSRVDQQLDHAESIMEEHPDSALTILQQIDGTTLHGEPQARHALLLSQAYYKNYIDVANDSLVSIATTYYKESNDTQHKMLAYYYLAAINKDAEHYGTALQAALSAHDEAKDLNDIFNLSRIESLIGRIYIMGGDYHEALRWDYIALNKAKTIGKSTWIQNGYINVAEELMALLRFQEAIQYADSAINISAEPNQDALEIKYLSYQSLNMTQEANSTLSTIASLGFMPTFDTTDLGNNSLEEIVHYQNSVIAAQNKRLLEITSHNLSEALYKYNINKTNHLNTQIKAKEAKIITLITVGALIITILILVIAVSRLKARNIRIHNENTLRALTNDYERVKNELEENLSELTQLQRNIKQLSIQTTASEENYRNIKQEISVAFLQRFSWIDKLGALYLDANLSGDKNEHVLYRKVSEELSASKRTSFISVIEKKHKAQYNDLWRELDSLNLIRSEKEMLLFFICGVSTRVICFITDKTPASIYSIKNRIKSKLQTGATPFALYLLTII